MPRVPQSEIERLKTEVSLIRVVEASGVKLEKRGRDFVGRCPFHEDRTPSFVVSPEKNLWNCLGSCGGGGDVIAFVMRREGVSFRHAVELLRGDDGPAAGTRQNRPLAEEKNAAASGADTLKIAQRSRAQKMAPLETSSADDQALLNRVAGYYHETLKASPEAQAYLKKRGLADAALIERFKLGYANRTLGYRLPASTRVAGAELRGRLQALGVMRASGHEHFSGSLVIPILDAAGNVAGLYGRKLLDNLRPGTAKHLYLPGSHKGVFNLAAFAASEEMILCEALIDALTFWAAGYRNVTAAYGVNGFTDEILAALKSNNVKRVLIAYDRDAAGEAGAVEAAEKLMAAGVECFRILFPKGMDANAYALAVKPAHASLGALIRSAEWIGAGVASRSSPSTAARAAGAEIAAKRKEAAESVASAAHAMMPALAASEGPAGKGKEAVETRSAASSENRPSIPLAAISERATSAAAAIEAPPATRADPQEPAPLQASPVPPGPPEIAAEIGEHEIGFAFGDRHWRVRGLAKNMSYEALRVNVLARREINGTDAFHVDAFDLYSARHRASFVAQAALELGLSAETVKADLAGVLLKLEALQDQQIRAALDTKPAAAAMTADEERAALDLLRAPDLLARIGEDAEQCGIVGERANCQALYLAFVSRKLEKPLAVLIQSTSAAGKSALMDAVLDFVPPESRVQYAAMTGQALFYLGPTAVKHKVLAIAEEEGAREASYALKLLQSQGDLSIASTGKDPVTGKLITQDYRVEGPVALAMTTTAIDLDEELKNRCLVLSVNETRAQTAAIHKRQRYEETLSGLMAGEDRRAIVRRHQNAQRMLKPLKVVNPYAEQLTFLADKTRSRRDHRKYLALIRAIALLHQHQRDVKSAVTSDGEIVDYVEATLDDIAQANALAHEVLGKTLDELPPQTRALLTLIQTHVRAACMRADMRQSDYRFTRREVREASGWGLTQLKIHLKRLEELDYLIPHVGGRGRSYVYELAYEGEGDDGAAFMMGLIDIEALRNNAGPVREGAQTKTERESRAYDEKKSGVKGELSGSSRPPVGPMSGESRGGDFANNAYPSAAYPDTDEFARNRASGAEKPHPSYVNGVVGAA
jgi:DNA primase catalytic core